MPGSASISAFPLQTMKQPEKSSRRPLRFLNGWRPWRNYHYPEYQPLSPSHPVIPGLNDQDIPKILDRARKAGATAATYILLRLNGNVEPIFLERMTHHFPDRIEKISRRLREMRGGSHSENAFFKRHSGQGPTWNMIQQLFEVNYRKAGFHLLPEHPVHNTFRRPGPTQLPLFATS